MRTLKDTAPFWKPYGKLWQSQADPKKLSFYSAEDLINSSRTSEELYQVKQYLNKRGDLVSGDINPAAGRLWKNVYDPKRLELATKPSYDPINKIFGVPIQPELYQREDIKGLRGMSYARNLLEVSPEEFYAGGTINLSTRPKLQFPKGELTNLSKAAFFDTETTGLLGKNADLLSYSVLAEGKQKDLFAKWQRKKQNYGKEVENVIKGYESSSRGKTLLDPKNIVEDFIGTMESKPIAGYNIREYDVPMFREFAEKFNLVEKFDKAFSKSEIIDVADYTTAFLSQKLGNEVVGRQASELGLKSYGWQLQHLAAGFGYKDAAKLAHTTEDVPMTKFVMESILGNKEFNKETYLSSLERTAVTSKTGEIVLPKFHKYYTQEELEMPFLEHLKRTRPDIKAGEGVGSFGMLADEAEIAVKQAVKESSKPIAKEATENITKSAGKPMWKLYAGTAAALGVLYWMLSPKKHDNTIEGMPEQGMSKDIRQGMTDFGSGYMGIPTSLNGQRIDPKIIQFRALVLNDPEAKQAFEQALKEEEASRPVSPLRYYDLDTSHLPELLNNRSKNLRRVRLEQFDMDVEDADTLLLKPKGLLGIISAPVQIRLAGIDAPEISHAGKEGGVLEAIRMWQSQPGGEESSQRFREMVNEYDELSLYVDPSNKTYGRYVGALFGDGVSLNLRAIREGLGTALPFGEKSEELINRDLLNQAEARAKETGSGIWQYARYQAIDIARRAAWQRTTHNTFTRVDKLAQNLKMGAYATFLEDVGYEQRELTPRERYKAWQMGEYINYYKGSKFSGMPNSGTAAASIREQHTDFKADFASRWDPVRNIAKEIFGHTDDAFERLLALPEFKEAIQVGLKESHKLGEGAFAEVFGHSAVMEHAGDKYAFEFASKKISGQSASLNNLSIKNEVSALKELGHMNAPSYYRMAEDDTILMEKFNIAGDAEGLADRQFNEVYDFLTYAHDKGITHGDLHSGNIKRVFAQTPEGKMIEEIGVLDWGARNRYSGFITQTGLKLPGIENHILQDVHAFTQEILTHNTPFLLDKDLDLANLYSIVKGNRPAGNILANNQSRVYHLMHEKEFRLGIEKTQIAEIDPGGATDIAEKLDLPAAQKAIKPEYRDALKKNARDMLEAASACRSLRNASKDVCGVGLRASKNAAKRHY